jgi:hypothetical protein
MNTIKLTGEEGQFISSAEAARFTGRYHAKKKSEGQQPGTYVEAQFYGKKQLQKLMDKEGCVGLRFYLGHSEDKELNDHIVVVAVNAEGKDLTRTRVGLKDMPAGDDDALAGGPCCPHNCNP